jgi:hypothetical protein
VGVLTGGGVCTTASGTVLPPLLCRDQELSGQTIRGGRAVRPADFLGGGPSSVLPVVDERGYSIPYRLILLVLAAAAAIAIVAIPIAKWLARRRLLRRSRAPRERVLAAYRVFDGRAADLGLGRREGETLLEHRARLSAALALSNGRLDRLTAAAARAAYASRPPTDQDAREAVADAEEVAADVRRDAGLLRRVVGAYRPGV